MGRRKRPGPPTKSVAASQPAKETDTKAKRAKKATAPLDLPPRARSRESRRVKGLSPERPPDDTGSALAPKAKSKPRSKYKRKGRFRKPPPPYPGHNSGADSPAVENSDDKPAYTETYVEKAPQTEHPGVTGEETTQTEHRSDVAEATSLPPAALRSTYSDPTEHWVMSAAQPEQPADADAPAIQSLRGTPAHQPAPSIVSKTRAKAQRKGSVARTTQSSTRDDPAATSYVYKRSNFHHALQCMSITVQLFMKEYDEKMDEEGVEASTQDLLENLKAESHEPEPDIRYKNHVLQRTMQRLQFRTEVDVIAELADLVCPPAERYTGVYERHAELRATYRLFVEARNEPWTKAPRLLDGVPAPKPDYCVGFCAKAFLAPEWALIATLPSDSPNFAVTDTMHFPFLTCEVKSHKQPISIADKQNAYSMMIAVSSTVDLFRAAKMERSVHRKVLGFSISYDNKNVVIDGWYPVIVGQCTEIYRTRIHDFTIRVGSGASDVWQSWHYVRNIYEVWAPEHRARLRVAINSLKLTVQAAGLGRNRDDQTPTPSEFAHLGLEQLGLQSPRLQAAHRADSVSVFSAQSRRRRAVTAPLGGDASPKRPRSIMG